MNQKRYIPPHARKAFSADKRSEPPMSLDERFAKKETVVTLKSKTKHHDFPGQLIEDEQTDKPPSDILCQTFKLDFQQAKLRELMRWFRNIGRDDPKAVLAFSSSLDKEQRKEIHNMANNFGLGSSSQGFGEKRYINVYTMEIAALGVGKISLTPEEKRRGEEVWYLVKKFGGEYFKYSHNEINEMIIAANLHPDLQDLLDKNQDVLADEFAEKCQLDSKKR